MSVSTLIPVSIFFEITLDKTFHAKPIEKKTNFINASNQKELFFDYRTINGEGYIMALPDFSLNVFQLNNQKAISEIQLNDRTQTVYITYINQGLDFSSTVIEKKIKQSSNAGLCMAIEETLNEVVNAKD